MNQGKESDPVKAFLAIEFTTAGVKAVEINQIGARFELISAQTIPTGDAASQEEQQLARKNAVVQLIQRKNLETTTFLLGINTPHTYFAQFVIPRVPQREVAEILKWKLKDEIPFSLEESTLSYRLL